MCELYIYEGVVYKTKFCDYDDIAESMQPILCNDHFNVGDFAFVTRYNNKIVLIEKLPNYNDDNYANAIEQAEINGRNFINNNFQNVDKRKIRFNTTNIVERWER